MKKLFFFIGLLFFAFVSKAQPFTHSQSSPTALEIFRGLVAPDSGLVFRTNWPDTFTINLGWLKNTPGIVVRVNDTLRKRNNTATRWDYLWSNSADNNYNLNAGNSYRLAIPYTPNIKTVFGGYAINIDSVTANTLSFRFDSTNHHTKDYNDGQYWRTTGNNGTVAGTNFVGTLDPVDLVLKRNSVEQFRLESGLNSIPSGIDLVMRKTAAIGTVISSSTAVGSTGVLKISPESGANSNQSIIVTPAGTGQAALGLLGGGFASMVLTSPSQGTNISSQLGSGTDYSAFNLWNYDRLGVVRPNLFNFRLSYNNSGFHKQPVLIFSNYDYYPIGNSEGKMMQIGDSSGPITRESGQITMFSQLKLRPSDSLSYSAPILIQGGRLFSGTPVAGSMEYDTITNHLWFAIGTTRYQLDQQSGSGLSYPYTTNKYLNGYGAFVALNTDSITEGSTNLFYTNTRARAAISLTTTGTSGAATYNNTTGVLNIPQYAGSSSGMAIGGLITSAKVNSALFSGTGGKLSQDSANYNYDSTNAFLRLGGNINIKNHEPLTNSNYLPTETTPSEIDNTRFYFPLFIDWRNNGELITGVLNADRDGGGHPYIVLNHSYDQGNTWNISVGDTVQASTLTGALSGGNGGVGFSGRIFIGYTITDTTDGSAPVSMHIKYSDDAKNWTTVNISHGSMTQFLWSGKIQKIAGDSLLMLWYGNDGTNYNIYGIKSGDNGATWGSSILFYTSTTNLVSEASGAYLGGRKEVIVMRSDNGSYMRQLYSSDNASSLFTDQGNITAFDATTHDMGALNAITLPSGERGVECVYADKSNKSIKAIYANAQDIINSGVAGWDIKSKVTLASTSGSNYLSNPIIAHAYQAAAGVGWAFNRKSSTNAAMNFFRTGINYQKSITINGDVTLVPTSTTDTSYRVALFDGNGTLKKYSNPFQTVNLTSVADGDILTYQNSTGYFVNTKPGSVSYAYAAKTSTYTAAATDYIIDATSGTFTVNLPTAVGVTGKVYIIKNSGAGTVTLDGNSSETIDGTTTKTLSVQYGGYQIISDGANWKIIATF